MPNLELRNPSPSFPSTTSLPPRIISPSITYQPPLSRRGHGPGLILILDHYANIEKKEGCLDPPPLQKWAEEGFAVVQVRVPGKEEDGGEFPLERAVGVLRGEGGCEFGKEGEEGGVGVVSYLTRMPFTIEETLCLSPHIKSLVSYGGKKLSSISHSTTTPPPQLLHIGGPLEPRRKSFSIATEPQSTQLAESSAAAPAGKVKEYRYVDAKKESSWVVPGEETYHAASAGLAHTRSLAWLKEGLGGPWFDIEEVWEEHCRYEFEELDVEKTMGTMVEEPYVNHITTLTGGIGQKALTSFYTHNFIFSNPPSTRLTLLSRTIGPSRIIDEFLVTLTHSTTIPWLLPDIPPTNLPLSIPMTSNVCLRGDRLSHEHISWDQGTVLQQLGLLPEFVPFPYEIEGRERGAGKRWEVRLPVPGKEAGVKFMDEAGCESNGLIGREGAVREVDDV